MSTMTDKTPDDKWRPTWKPRREKKNPTNGQRPRTREAGTLNPMQRAWIDAHLKGMSDKDAALAAGYSESTARTHGYRLRHHPLVVAELRKIEERLREQTVYDCAAAFSEQGRLMELAIEAGQLNAAVKAAEARARLHGLLVDRTKADITVSSTVDLRAALAAANARILPPTLALPNSASLLPMRDQAEPHDAEFRDISDTSEAGPSDNESVPDLGRVRVPDLNA